MTDQTPDPEKIEDTEGHQHKAGATEDQGTSEANDTEDDTQGHVTVRPVAVGEDDFDVTEGRRRRI